MRGTSRERLVALVCVLVIIVIVAAAYFSNHPVADHLILDADAFHIPVALNEILSGEAQYFDWSYPASPGIFPEWLIWALTAAWVPNLYWQLPAFAAGQLLAIGIIVAFLSRAMRYSRWVWSGFLATFTILTFSLVWPDPLWISWTTAFHFGSFLTSLICVTLIAYSLNASQRITRWAINSALLLTVTFGVMSDAFVVPQTTLPLVLILLALLLNRRWRLPNAYALVLVLILGSFLGIQYDETIIPNSRRPSIQLSISNLLEKLSVPMESLSGLATHGAMLLLIVLFVYVIMILWLVVSVRREGLAALHSPNWMLAIFCFASASASALAVLLLPVEVVPRYLITFYLWPIIWAAIQISRYSVRKLMISFALLATACCVSVGNSLHRNGLQFDYYPEPIRCLDKNLEGATHGIASYWDARWFQAYSRQPITIAPVIGSPIQKFDFNTNKRYFQAEYQFVIAKKQPVIIAMHDVAKGQAESQFGWPKRSVDCGDRTILFYDGLRLARE